MDVWHDMMCGLEWLHGIFREEWLGGCKLELEIE